MNKTQDENIENIESLFRAYNTNKSNKIRNQIASKNQALVTFIVNKYYNYRAIHKKYREDLLQEGTIGLLSAIDGFDVDKGFKFSTYATWWIKQAVNNYIVNMESVIHVPSHIRTVQNKLNNKLKEENKTIQSILSEEKTDNKETQISDKMVSNVRCAIQSRFVHSLDNILSNKNSTDNTNSSTLQDVIIENENIDTESGFDKIKLLNIINEGIQSLSQKEKYILLLRFDLIGDEQMSSKKIFIQKGQKRVKVKKI